MPLEGHLVRTSFGLKLFITHFLRVKAFFKLNIKILSLNAVKCDAMFGANILC